MRGWPRVTQALPYPAPLPAPQKLQLVLAPLHSLASRALEHGLPDPGSLLAHSFRQLERIDSLSEQVSFLEEQLGSCECRSPHTHLPTRVPLLAEPPRQGGWGERVGAATEVRGQIWLDWGDL